MIRRLALLLLAAAALFALAQEVQEKRIISIDSSGGTQSGNLRFGPIVYQHPDPEGIVATVSTLTIYSHQAELRGPEDERLALTEARGRRTATFADGVRVTRGRLEARGPELSYSEASGLGTLTGGITIRVAPREADDDPVDISAREAEFDVDTDVSVSRGEVELLSGNQRAAAETLVYEEERALGCLSSEGAQVRAKRTEADGDELTITADEICTLTDEDRLLARGNVALENGDITSEGDTIFFDDPASRALVLGNPAVSRNAADGVVTRGAVLEQRTDLDAVRVYSDAVPFDEAAFALSERPE